MSGHFNSIGNAGLLKTQYVKNKLAGEKLSGFEFELAVKDYPMWTVLVRSAAFPAMGRSDIEDYGPAGLLFVQHGALENSVEITVTTVEPIVGVVLQDLRDIIKNKQYVDMTLRVTSESMSGMPGRGHEIELLDCKIRSDALELSTEDTAALAKISMTIRCNFIDL